MAQEGADEVTALDKYINAYAADAKHSLDNRISQPAYARRVIDLLGGFDTCRKLQVLDLGLGHGFTTEVFANAFDTYHVVDGSAEMIEAFWRKHDRSSFNATVFESYFETFTPPIVYDAIVMGFVLEHVEDPLAIVHRFGGYLKRGGRMFIAVPNAVAMHRRLGHLAGMLDDMYALSEHDLALGHRRYFDPDKLKKLIEDAGFTAVRLEGIFLKPVTSSQLSSLNFSEAILGALVKLGIDYPELSNSILAEAQRT